MKVLQVINNLSGGGAEKLVTEMTIELNKRDIRTDILILNNQEDKYSGTLKKEGVRIINLNKRNIYNPIIILSIIKFLKNYDVIHVHLFPSLYWVAFSSFFIRKNFKLIYTEHSTHNKRRKFKLLNFLEKFIYSRFDEIISITDEVETNLINWLKPKDKLKYKVINNGINLDKFKYAKKYDKKEIDESLSESSVIITMASRFSEQKDQKTLIKTMKYLPANYHLLLVGEGELKKECEKIVNGMNLKERIHFLGFRKDIPEIFKTSDIVVQSSHWEGFGLTAVEAMASGTPIIASDVHGLSNVVKDAGILFESQDEKNLQKEILRLINDKNFYEETRNKCIVKSDDYNIENMFDGYLKIYKK